MKSTFAVLPLFTFIQFVVNNASVIRRQAPDYACAAAINGLSFKEQECIYGSAYYRDEYDYESEIFSAFTEVCSDPFCSNVIIRKVIPKCRVSVLSVSIAKLKFQYCIALTLKWYLQLSFIICLGIKLILKSVG